MKHVLAVAAMVAASVVSTGVGATTPAPTNVVNLSASGFLEVPQDWMTVQLSTTREGRDAAQVQAQLKAALDAALTMARSSALPEAMEVRTGNFSLQPRYGNQGRLDGWQGTAELLLEGKDFGRISAVAGRLPGLTLAGVGFSLSRQARQKLESDVQTQAIERFRQRAQEVSRSFGFQAYTLREVHVSSTDMGQPMRPRMAAMEAKAMMADAPLPVEAGKSTVQVTVSGAIQMQ